MVNKSIISAACACLAVASLNVNAVVLNTLSGVDYEWLELTATAGMSRDQVEVQLADVNSALYGYEYASRSLVEDLYLSYTSFDGLDGLHGDNNVINGIKRYFDDFGVLEQRNVIVTKLFTVDLEEFPSANSLSKNLALYGASDECGTNRSCLSRMTLYTNSTGNDIAVEQRGEFGWDSTDTSKPSKTNDFQDALYGSYLVRTSVVPVPAAIWLFGSGLVALIGFARRNA